MSGASHHHMDGTTAIGKMPFGKTPFGKMPFIF
jgi:hypothetical protein